MGGTRRDACQARPHPRMARTAVAATVSTPPCHPTIKLNDFDTPVVTSERQAAAGRASLETHRDASSAPPSHTQQKGV